jgi:hypothetical protein
MTTQPNQQQRTKKRIIIKRMIDRGGLLPFGRFDLGDALQASARLGA